MKMNGLRIALTGATGYVGGMLIEPLASHAAELRCISRNPSRLKLPALSNVTTATADVAHRESLIEALRGCDVAYYLVHSLGEKGGFSQLEAESASTFAAAAHAAGIKRIIYLGALAQSDSDHTSAHILSRHKVGELLGSTGVPVTEFRASVILGAGSMPFEAIRALVERLPIMVTPRWVRMPVQPIGAADLVRYLVAAVEEVGTASHVYEIGGSEVTTYAKLMRSYGRARGLRRFMVPVPVITPRLSSLWLRLVTPAHYRIGKHIVDSAAHSSVVATRDVRPPGDFKPVDVDTAIADALFEENRGLKFLDESDNGSHGLERMRIGNKFVERRTIRVDGAPDAVMSVLRTVGGQNGWFWATWLWQIRGALDRVVGGPGMRASQTVFPPKPGEILDFWTVVRCDDNRLTLRADMKLPGEAWLDLSVKSADGETYVEQTAAFDPRGLGGILYWYGLYPLHTLVFGGMLRGIKRAASRSLT